MTPEELQALLDRTYRRRGSTARSWICEECGADVDSSGLRRHLLERACKYCGSVDPCRCDDMADQQSTGGY